MCAVQRYLCCSDTINTISSPVVNTDSKKDSIDCAHYRDVYVIVTGNRVRSLIRTLMHGTVSSARFKEMFML